MTNGRPKDDASSDFLEISKDENQTDATIRSLGAAHSDDWLSDKNPDQVIYKEIVTDAQHSLGFAFAAGTSATTMYIARSNAVKNAESHGETVKGTKEPDWNSNDLKVTDIDIVDIDQKETIEHMQPDVQR